jgi:hypothetical protein
MAIAILLGVLLLVGAGLVIALKIAAAARRELENLEGEFAEARGGLALDSDSDPVPWSSVDLEILRDDVIVVEGVDPFDTLTDMISPAAWQAAQESNGSEHAAEAWDDSDEADDLEHAAASWLASQEPNGSEHTAAAWDDSEESDDLEHAAASWFASRESNGSEYTAASWLASQESNGSQHTSSTDLAPVEDMAPVASRPSGDAPIIILVVGVGFLGTGMTAGVTTADRLRQAWGEVESSFSQARVITLDPEARHAAPSAFDPEGAREAIVVEEEHDDPFPTRQENGDSQVRWPPPRPNGLGSRRNGGSRPNGGSGPNGGSRPSEPEPIEWRAPGDYARR